MLKSPSSVKVTLIWVDATAKEPTTKSVWERLKLHSDLQPFEDTNSCIQFLQEKKCKRAILIASGKLGKELVPKIHDRDQIVSIYIFEKNSSISPSWTNQWPKIQGVFHDLNPIVELIDVTVKGDDSEAVAMSFVQLTGDEGKRRIKSMEPTFLYTSLFRDILFRMKHGPQAKTDMVQCCRKKCAEDACPSADIDEFERSYKQEKAIQWYSKESFLCYLLNRALRTFQADVIVNMGFYINDLHRHIYRLDQEQRPERGTDKFLVYRGITMFQEDLAKYQDNEGLISFDSFLSTSRERRVALDFIQMNLQKESEKGKLGVLFIMEIDPKIDTTTFADIESISEFSEEKEVLFTMQTVFRIKSFSEPNSECIYYQVSLALTDDREEDLELVRKTIEKEIMFEDVGKDEIDPDKLRQRQELQCLGHLLMKVHQVDRAKELYETLLKKRIEPGEKAYYYHQLGLIRTRKDQYSEAVKTFEEAIKIMETVPKTRKSDKAVLYNNLGSAYLKQNNHEKALAAYEKARALQETNDSDKKSADLGTTYSNIGSCHFELDQIDEALKAFQKTQEIFKANFPSIHPARAINHSNIASVYFKKKNYEEALAEYQRALEIQQRILTKDHPSLAITHNNIALVLDKIQHDKQEMSNDSDIMHHYEAAQKIVERSRNMISSVTHNNLGVHWFRQEEYGKATSSIEESFSIQQENQIDDHLVTAAAHHNLGAIHYKNRDYQSAEKEFLIAQKIRHRILKESHSDRRRTDAWLKKVQEKLAAETSS